MQTGLKSNIDEAVIKRALENNLSGYMEQFTKVDEIPFDFARRRLSVIVNSDNQNILITKGAVEEILSICTTIKSKRNSLPITKEIQNNILSTRTSNYTHPRRSTRL